MITSKRADGNSGAPPDIRKMIIKNKCQWTIENKKIDPNTLHGAQFYAWFDQQFRIESLPEINSSPPDITKTAEKARVSQHSNSVTL